MSTETLESPEIIETEEDTCEVCGRVGPVEQVVFMLQRLSGTVWESDEEIDVVLCADCVEFGAVCVGHIVDVLTRESAREGEQAT